MEHGIIAVEGGGEGVRVGDVAVRELEAGGQVGDVAVAGAADERAHRQPSSTLWRPSPPSCCRQRTQIDSDPN